MQSEEYLSFSAGIIANELVVCHSRADITWISLTSTIPKDQA